MKRINGFAVAALVAFLMGLNLAGSLVYWRWDLSEGKVYSVSAATRRILKSLRDPVIVKVYFTEGLPEPYATYGTYLKDLLRAYRLFGGKNFEFKFVRYPDEDQFRREALTQGITPVQITYIAKDKYEVKDGFMGAVILHADRREVIPVVRDLSGLEYDLTGRIKKLSSREVKTLAIVEGKGAMGLPDALEKELRENYEIKNLSLNEALDFSRPPSAVLILGPRQKFEEPELAKLEQLVLSGVPLGLFLDRKEVDLAGGSFYARPLKTGLERLLENWGLVLEDALVCDLQSQNISIQRQAGPFVINNIVNFPLMPLVTALDKGSPVTKDLDQITLPFVSPISTRSLETADLTVLAASSRMSWSKSQFISLSPLARFDPDPQDPRGPFVLAASVVGRFRAVFPRPPKVLEKEVASGAGWLSASRGQSRVLLCGTSRLADSRLMADAPSQAFVLNAADWLMQDPDLIAIRSKGVRIRPFLLQPGYVQRQVIKIVSLFLMPAVIVALGMLRWRSRRHWKKTLKQSFASV